MFIISTFCKMLYSLPSYQSRIALKYMYTLSEKKTKLNQDSNAYRGTMIIIRTIHRCSDGQEYHRRCW